MRLPFRRSGEDRPSDEEDIVVEETRPCRHCGAQVSRGASVCMYCERDLTPIMPPEVFRLHFGGGPRPPGEEERSTE